MQFHFDFNRMKCSSLRETLSATYSQGSSWRRTWEKRAPYDTSTFPYLTQRNNYVETLGNVDLKSSTFPYHWRKRDKTSPSSQSQDNNWYVASEENIAAYRGVKKQKCSPLSISEVNLQASMVLQYIKWFDCTIMSYSIFNVKLEKLIVVGLT